MTAPVGVTVNDDEVEGSSDRHASVFWRWALGITGAALVLRVVNVLILRPTVEVCESFDGCFQINGDAAYGHFQGEYMAKGEWFISWPQLLTTGEIRPGAGDPPLFALFLAEISALHGSGTVLARLIGLSVLAGSVAVSWLIARRIGGPRTGRTAAIVAGVIAVLLLLAAVLPANAVTAHRLATAVVGAAGVLLIGLVARALLGDRAGVIAIVLAAIHPLLWINDAMVLSETLYVPMVAIAVLAGYRFWNRPTGTTAAVLGGAIALAALTRAEAGMLLAFMVVPLAWGSRDLGAGRRVGLVAIAGLVAGAIMAPWFAYNLARFEEPTFMTSGTGAVLSAGSCDTAFYGEYVGYYANCYEEYVLAGSAEWPPDDLDESERDAYSREAALDYLREQERRLPAVVAFRVARMFDVYEPVQSVQVNYRVEGRGRMASAAGAVLYAVMVPFGVLGAAVMARRRLPLSPLLSVVLAVVITAAMTFGVTRYRVPADAVLVVAAAVGVEWLLRRRWPSRERGWVRPRPRTSPRRPAPADSVETTS